MGKAHSPRHGSMQYWPRVRARRSYARVRSWPVTKEVGMLGFAGFKVGMTQVLLTDNRPNALTKGEDIIVPVTVIECPPLRVIGLRGYKTDEYGAKASAEVWAKKQDKYLSRKLTTPKKDVATSLDSLQPSNFSSFRLIVHTQPAQTGIGKKRPDVFEVGIGGSVEEQFTFAKEKIGQDITINDVFDEGEIVDTRVITKGKGFQGPVKRFGVAIRAAKSEKTKRGPGSLGSWRGQGHMMYRVAHAGQMGFHQRCEFNKQILKIGNDPKDVNVDGGYIRFGNVKSTYVLLKGSVGGAKTRVVQLTRAQRAKKRKQEAPSIISISTASPQKR